MGGFSSPPGMGGGPPVPPSMPSMSAYRGPGGFTPSNSGGGAAIPKLVFALDKALDNLARALPEQGEKIAQIKSLLKDVLVNGASGRTSEGNPGMEEEAY